MIFNQPKNTKSNNTFIARKHTSVCLALISLFSVTSFNAFAAPSTSELENYLVIATKSGEAFNSNSGELGADQEVVSSGSGWGEYANESDETQQHSSYTSIGIDLTGTFVSEDGKGKDNSNNRWEDADPDYVDGDTVGTPDYLLGAKLLEERPDYSGNVAVTNSGGYAVSENTDYFASIGIQCNRAAADCLQSNDKDNSWKQSDADAFVDLESGAGVSQFDSTNLLAELAAWRGFINGLAVESSITDKDITDQSYKDGGTPYTTDLDAIDTNNDGFAIIDIDLDDEEDFKVSNTDWILQTDSDVVAIFRMKNSGNYLFDNTSIMMSCSDKGDDACLDETVTELGAIFFTDNSKGDQAFNLNNVILGGVGLWDLDDDPDTKITFNNVQGCTHLVSSRVELSSHNRLNRCSFNSPTTTTEVPEPSTLIILMSGLLGLMFRRRQAS